MLYSVQRPDSVVKRRLIRLLDSTSIKMSSICVMGLFSETTKTPTQILTRIIIEDLDLLIDP